jgi:putative flippase GtrA
VGPPKPSYCRQESGSIVPNSVRLSVPQYVVQGSANFGTNFFCYYSLVWFGLNPFVAGIVGFVLGMMTGFLVAQKRLPQEVDSVKSFLRNLVLGVLSVSIYFLILYFSIEFGSIHVAPLIAAFFSTVVNFFGLRFFVFVAKTRSVPESA